MGWYDPNPECYATPQVTVFAGVLVFAACSVVLFLSSVIFLCGTIFLKQWVNECLCWLYLHAQLEQHYCILSLFLTAVANPNRVWQLTCHENLLHELCQLLLIILRVTCRKSPRPPSFAVTGGTILYKRPSQQTYAMTSSSLLANDNRFTTMPIDGEQGIYENNLDGYTFSYPRKSWNCRAIMFCLIDFARTKHCRFFVGFLYVLRHVICRLAADTVPPYRDTMRSLISITIKRYPTLINTRLTIGPRQDVVQGHRMDASLQSVVGGVL